MRNDELWGNIRKGFAKVHDELDSAAREHTAIKAGQIEELDAKVSEAAKDRQRMSGQIEGVDAHVRGLAQVLVDTGQLRRDETDEAARAAGTVTVRRRTRRPPGPELLVL